MQGGNGELKKRVKREDVLIFAGIVDARSGSAIEAFHEAGYDAVMIDREHTALNSETILEQIRLARALHFPVMVRVADLSYAELNRTLDQLPDGLFVPRIRSRAEVENVVQTIKYAPLGRRGLGASTCPAARYMGWSSPIEQIERLNNDTVLGIQIETAEALADLDGILSIPGVDIAVVGGDDLTMSMGIPGQTAGPEFRDAVEKVIAACNRHGVLPGIAVGDPSLARDWIERGMRVVWYAVDVCLLWQAARDRIDLLRAELANLDTTPVTVLSPAASR